ncbi:helix-turn-helix domain-containing protein [Neobacillus ginsengisoli]|uniref:DNA-binding Lrp family transcriptional regulator n=1 Tax=Neobacillus ginsengisoli TaxID=904295 RepID=A0ABT9XQW4_9BACI|nr:helix-turn-helix domain-containing protein [Neobacillus ginsengisoli]MDQ0197944.1 DNA-binding Lrp family transcriptional regulator [Neobacillus ginsengisoli]
MTTPTIVTSTEEIFEQGNKHMMEKLRTFGSQGQAVIKYIISKLRKYHGSFFESNSTIAESVGCSVRTVQNTIKKAEQLNIFAVSPRKELDELTGKIRQTTNLIQLLVYAPLKKIKKVIVEAVREVKEKAEIVVQEVKEVLAPKKSKHQTKPSSKPHNKITRTELLPDWFDKDTETKSVVTDETLKAKADILARLKSAGF